MVLFLFCFVEIFDSRTSELITYHQTPVKQYFPKEGWVEEDPVEILNTVRECIEKATDNLQSLEIDVHSIKAIGITNQRESTIAWDRFTGKPLYNAIIWLDTRTVETVASLIEKTPGHDKNFFRPRCGLPISTYFSATKMRWLIDNCPSVQEALADGRCVFGTVDSWLVWNLTGGPNGGRFVTDVTNASRTMLMNLRTLAWDTELCHFFKIPLEVLPEICSSSEIYGDLSETRLKGIPISAILGDQQAALVGQGCLKRGNIKNTYGTGCFLLCNTGSEIIESEHGLLTTVAYQFGRNRSPCYALEGSVAIAGAAVTWLQDNLGLISDASQLETLASSVPDTCGCYFVPAFSGLFCPYWQTNARGILCGLSQYTKKSHIARACLEAVCFQTRDVMEAMYQDSGMKLTLLRVDGGMAANNLLMQMQSDLVGINVVRPSMLESTALGAAMAAGMAEGIDIWKLNEDQINDNATADVFVPSISESDRDRRFAWWTKAVKRSMDWELSDKDTNGDRSSASLPYGLFAVLSFAIVLAAELLFRR